MPIYEYRCQNCQREIEVMQKMSDDALVHCDACGKDTLTKLISRSSFQLKGTGWYQTDFKNPVKPESKSENKAENKADSSTETKTENKSEAKSETAPATASGVKKTSDTSGDK
jgi:putative FmdB family regulatory protein